LLAVFRPRDFLLSENKEEVLSKLKANGKHVHVIAGGTGFYELARRGYIPEVKYVVSIMKLGLDYVRNDADNVTIGATTKLQDLLESGIGDTQGFEALGDALREIRPVQIRNVATVGGEICISVPIVDLPTALLACNASLFIMNQTGEYATGLEEFYIDAFLTRLKYGEIVKEVRLKKNPAERSAFVKIGRTAYDFNLINAAVSLSTKSDGKLNSLKIFLGGIKRTPLRAASLEKKLLGKNIDEKTIVSAVEDVFEKEKLFPSVHGSSEYKMAILPIVLRDCILKALDRAK
jgi:CO/xanthine dehydrogenase FAD-binding subunit